MIDDVNKKERRIYKLVLTGGPCGGKTTGQNRLISFFEGMGWKVYGVPETASILIASGVKFCELNEEQVYTFQKDLLLTMLRIEQTFFNLAELEKEKDVLIICDRGTLDPSVYISKEGWNSIINDLNLSQFDLRDNRYNHVIHMVSAADGAEEFYTLSNNAARTETISQAIELDRKTREAWIGHPYVDVVDNQDCKTFEDKISKLIQIVCERIGISDNEGLSSNSRKRKWLVMSFDESRFPNFEEFIVNHDYLISEDNNIQIRVRERRQGLYSTYTITTRIKHGENHIETRTQINYREYIRYLQIKDHNKYTLHKRRRCFQYGTQFYHLDIFINPLPKCLNNQQLMILETYSTKPVNSPLPELPSFLNVVKEITNDKTFSMYNLADKNMNYIKFD
uniref:AAA_28 domain-containing protein n=1 Tax=Strongyloides venezuelensis TaxID=75913 RepID=A0A0K0FK30_STRVS